jgi:hypothetical protein
MVTAVKPKPQTVQTIRFPVELNKVIDRERFFIFVVDLLTALVDRPEKYAMMASGKGRMTIYLGDHEYDVRHAQRPTEM